MLTCPEYMDIKHLHREGHSIRQICRITGVSRNTVRKALRATTRPRFATPERGSHLDPHKDYLKRRYQEHGLSAVRLIEEIRPMGYTGSVDVVRRFLATLKAGNRQQARATVRYETGPGEQAQVDWKHAGCFRDPEGQTVKIYAFVMVLSFSRAVFVRFTTSMRLAMLLECHEAAFAFFGGVTRRILYDNMRQVRLGYHRWNPKLEDFCAHHGFQPTTHRPYRPRTKGKVERAIQYLDDNFLKARSFADLAELNAQALHWCNHTANLRVHATTRKRPVDLLAKEKLARPHTTPYRLNEPQPVDAESMVAYNGSRYSVPPAYIGRDVVVESDHGRIVVRSGALVLAEHPEATRKRSSVVKREHIAELWRRTVPDAARRAVPHWQLRFDDAVSTTSLQVYEEVVS